MHQSHLVPGSMSKSITVRSYHKLSKARQEYTINRIPRRDSKALSPGPLHTSMGMN